jgi:hypothetical protein
MASGSSHSSRGKRGKWTVDIGLATIIAAIIVAVASVAGVFFIGRATSGASPVPTAPGASHSPASVVITEPPAGNTTFKTTLSGDVSNLQSGQLIWTFVQAVNNNNSFSPDTYPTEGPCSVNYNNGTWICSGVYIGDPKDTGTYRVCAAVVDSSDAFAIVELLEQTEAGSSLNHRFWFTSPPPYIHDNTDACMTIHRIN